MLLIPLKNTIGLGGWFLHSFGSHPLKKNGLNVFRHGSNCTSVSESSRWKAVGELKHCTYMCIVNWNKLLATPIYKNNE